MIRVDRGQEPSDLPAVRAESLKVALAKHLSQQEIDRVKDLPDSYRTYAERLWQAQHLKCAYCEMLEQVKRNDVEHFRPAGRAMRAKGDSAPGYWWLAYTWSNLLFSCRNCNQSGGKLDWFPLEPGSVPLAPLEDPPGGELATLVDPANESPLDHIEFTHQLVENRSRWIPRGKSPRGQRTVQILDLTRVSLTELYSQHVTTTVQPAVTQLQNGQIRLEQLCDWLLRPSVPFVALSIAAISQLLGVPSGQFVSAAKRRGC
ncbi:MAG: hypothetical protein ABTQ32_39685 [Myxococcaceae bacterium]